MEYTAVFTSFLFTPLKHTLPVLNMEKQECLRLALPTPYDAFLERRIVLHREDETLYTELEVME